MSPSRPSRLAPRRLAANARLLARMARMERRLSPGAAHPSLWARGFLSCRAYDYPGVHDPSVPFISDLKAMTRLGGINGLAARALLIDKGVFADELAARGLGRFAPEIYGILGPNGFRPRIPEAAERMRAQGTVVVKPADGFGGRQVRLIPGSDVQAFPRPDKGHLLVQEHVRQHPDLLPVHSASLNTMRVLGIRLPEGPVLAAAVHRWGTATTGPVDNVSSGGLCSTVDLTTGRLGPAVDRTQTRRRIQHDDHPDTGVRITGRLVPQWSEVRELALTLVDAFPEAKHVGWDLCASDRGPLVIEGNGDKPNVTVFQLHGSFLQDERLRRFYVEHDLLPDRHLMVTPAPAPEGRHRR